MLQGAGNRNDRDTVIGAIGGVNATPREIDVKGSRLETEDLPVTEGGAEASW